MAGDAYYGSVSLLLHCDGANDSTAFVDSSPAPKTVTAVGAGKLSTAIFKFGTASAVFGTSTANAVNCAASLGYTAQSAPFTIECFVYPTAYSATGGRMVCAGGGAAAYNSTTGIHWLLQSNSTGVDFQWWNGAASASLTAPIPLNQQAHVLVSYDGTTVRLFLDGVLKASLASTMASPSTTPTLSLGAIPGEPAGGNNYTGYIDELRITKGIARYTSAFSPPSAAFLDYAGQVSGVIRDDAGTPCARTVRAYRRDTGALAGATVSDGSTGSYTLSLPTTDEVSRIVLDDVAGTLYNDLIDRVIPA
jgi:hypothetical protein